MLSCDLSMQTLFFFFFKEKKKRKEVTEHTFSSAPEAPFIFSAIFFKSIPRIKFIFLEWIFKISKRDYQKMIQKKSIQAKNK